MSDDQIKSGAIVYLKSGGPAMTVGSFNGPNIVFVRWFVGEELKHAQIETLVLTTENPDKKTSSN